MEAGTTSSSAMRCILLWLMLTAVCCQAHVVQQLFVDFSTEPEQWSASIRFDAGMALPSMRVDKESPQPTREWLTEQTPEQHAQLRSEAEAYIRSCLQFSNNLSDLDYQISFPEWSHHPPQFRKPFTDMGFAYFDLVCSGTLPAPRQTLNLTLSDGEHPDFAIGFADSQSLLTLTPGQSITLISAEASQATTAQSLWNFLGYGYRHVIPKGWDHVLFIAALCCISLAWKPLLLQSLVFTIGHTITLALSINDWIPPFTPKAQQFVELSIALTIVYVAIENLFASSIRKRRLAGIFAFGLIHGLGFASVLGATIRQAESTTLPLIAANLGVEFGQITVIVLCLIAFYPFHKRQMFSSVRISASTLIACVGLFWVVQRISF